MLGIQIIGPAAELCKALNLATKGDFDCAILDVQFSRRRAIVTGLCQSTLPGKKGSRSPIPPASWKRSSGFYVVRSKKAGKTASAPNCDPKGCDIAPMGSQTATLCGRCGRRCALGMECR